MMDLTIVFILVFSFLCTLFLIPSWIKKASSIGLVWDDMNKIVKHKVSGSGGIAVLIGFLLGSFLFISYKTFILKEYSNLTEMLALSLVVVLASLIGFIDDLIGWKKGGLSRRTRMVLLSIAAVPLMAINSGKDEILIPFFGNIDVGIFYPLILIPIGIVGATSTYNFLAGYNGLEAGQGILILSALSIVSYFTGSIWLSMIAFTMVVCLLAFLFFNFYPAKVFPGDSLTYAIGSLIAGISILGNFEKIAIFFFIPYILETVLKARGKLVKHSFGIPNKDGSIDAPYEKIYGLEHAAILLLKKLKIKTTESIIVVSIWIFQLMVIILGFIIFRKGIF